MSNSSLFRFCSSKLYIYFMDSNSENPNFSVNVNNFLLSSWRENHDISSEKRKFQREQLWITFYLYWVFTHFRRIKDWFLIAIFLLVSFTSFHTDSFFVVLFQKASWLLLTQRSWSPFADQLKKLFTLKHWFHALSYSSFMLLHF